MSNRKPIKKELQPYESTIKVMKGGKLVNDSYTRITNSLLHSEAFQDLTHREQMLYISMRLQEYGTHKPNRDYKETSPYGDIVNSDLCFYYPWNTAKKDSKKYKDNSGRLYQDIDRLIEHGLIEEVLNGRTNRVKNVYKYSDKWHDWKKPKPP